MAKLSSKARFCLLTAAALVVAGVTFSLGQWQLRRAAQKQNLQLTIEAQSSQPILKVQDLSDPKILMDAVYRRATLKGIWRPEHTLFLDNRQMNGKQGFFVITPLALEGTGKVILVQRGWVPRSFVSRTALPEIQTPLGTVTVSGRIAPPPSKLYEFKGAETGRIRQNIDVVVFSNEIALPVMAVSLLQVGPATEGLLRDWAVPNVGIDRHYGYAFQWFGLCALIVGLYVWFQLINPLRVKRKTSFNV
jgi:surfeit locus 1 family protein